MRLQKRTYATDAAKNAIVTAIQRTSCIGISSGGFVIRIAESESNPLVRSERSAGPLSFNTHFYELSPTAGRTELRKVNLYGTSRRPHCFSDESCQHAQQESHRADAQDGQRNSHGVTGAPVAENCCRGNCSSPRVRAESKVHKEFVRIRTRVSPRDRAESPAEHSAAPFRLARLGIILSNSAGPLGCVRQFEKRQTGRCHHQFTFVLWSSLPGRDFLLRSVTVAIAPQSFPIVMKYSCQLLGRDILNR
jgi:hypothetical protein